jgi:hypothetical protein
MDAARRFASGARLAVGNIGWLMACGGDSVGNAINSCEYLNTSETPMQWHSVKNVPEDFCGINTTTISMHDEWMISIGGATRFVFQICNYNICIATDIAAQCMHTM